MASKKQPEFYTDKELEKIQKQWQEDKARIDQDIVFGYYIDRDREYERHLSNSNLKALFRHAAYLRQRLRDNAVFLYPNEIPLVSRVYERIVKNGYFTKSRQEEKSVRVHLGKAVSRQTRPKGK